MGDLTAQRGSAEVWALIRRQHGVVSWEQLKELGLSQKAVKHRIAKGRLHRIHHGVYAVGRPELSQRGRWMAAVLRCGPTALLSHASAGALWGIRPERRSGRPQDPVEISVNAAFGRHPAGIRIHRRSNLTGTDLANHDGFPVTAPVTTLIDLAATLSKSQLSRAINEADRLDLIDPEALRAALQPQPRRPGIAKLRQTLDHDSFRLTDSELERRFLALVRRAGLPAPETQAQLNGFRVDFKSLDPSHAPDLGLVVETDGLRYHRTPAQQSTDLRRDQAHASAGLERLRFSHAQVRYQPRHVVGALVAVIRRLSARRPHGD